MDWEKDCQKKFWKNFLIPLGLETCKATRRQADKARRINALAYELKGLLQFFRIWGSSFSDFFSKKHGFKNSELIFCYGSSFSDIAFLKFLVYISYF